MPVARIRIFGFYFHLDFGYFILFVYRMQQKLKGYFVRRYRSTGSTQRGVLLSSYSGTTPSLNLNCHGHCDSPVESPPFLYPPFSFLYFACSADERDGGGEGQVRRQQKKTGPYYIFPIWSPHYLSVQSPVLTGPSSLTLSRGPRLPRPGAG
jgi:hypothetical protein